MLELFLDPVLRAPTLGCMLMALFSGLIGCLVFLQKRSLVGEALSHASYPGVILGAFLGSLFLSIGGFVSAALGLVTLNILEKKVKSDAALCFVLSAFFGVGVLFASRLQVSNPIAFQEGQIFLFGQAATMVDWHIYLYGALALMAIGFFVTSFRTLELAHFDGEFAKSVGVRIHHISSILLILAIIVGMRSVGVILMSAMLIGPPVAARQWVRGLGPFFALSALFGMISGLVGNYLSNYAFPTGPMIVLTASSLALFSLLFAPERGAIARAIRRWRFSEECSQENALKDLLKTREVSFPPLRRILMTRKGWIEGDRLTSKGEEHAARLIHLHRLWEAYIIHMGQGMEKGHQSAEEMEHILTEEVEEELERLLSEGSVS